MNQTMFSFNHNLTSWKATLYHEGLEDTVHFRLEEAQVKTIQIKIAKHLIKSSLGTTMP